jgi:hypothetical protein
LKKNRGQFKTTMVRQSVTRDGNMFVQYGRGYQQHGGEEAHFEKIDAEQAELDTEEREINALFDEMMRAEMLAGEP